MSTRARSRSSAARTSPTRRAATRASRQSRIRIRTCSQMCVKGGCFCQDGFLRDRNGECVPAN
ncbi:hypothetical protein F5X71_20275 [Nocardia brasiliensis]|uniref:TIL domain-containing protein n=1 Tax=Nocardia brasiliensis TaxID=37326 RepID=A0A6G9XTR8_NOCBR|nr:hypothetical protein F5X71_20275 [Nocardia brasiliensis]